MNGLRRVFNSLADILLAMSCATFVIACESPPPLRSASQLGPSVPIRPDGGSADADRPLDGVLALACELRGNVTTEKYVSRVTLRNQTPLGSSAMAFATYLNAMHNRIHPLFADRFVDSLAALPADALLNDMRLVTRLEIVLRQDGQITAMGVVKTSGVPAFDRAALNAVQCAAPFGSAPNAIRTNDDRVYVHWEFHRDPIFSCSTMRARPFLLALPGEGGIISL